jgi:hypothetical protein
VSCNECPSHVDADAEARRAEDQATSDPRGPRG